MVGTVDVVTGDGLIYDHVFKASSGGGLCVYAYPEGVLCGGREGRHNRVFVTPEVSEPTASEAEIAFGAYAEAVQALVRVKDKAYGGAWQKQGYMGNLARILSKAERLQQLMWSDHNPFDQMSELEEEETVVDTLKDLMALAAFMAANIEDGNRWGR